MMGGRAGLSGRRGGILKTALALLVFLAALGTLGWMLLLPSALVVEVETRTGFPVEAGQLAGSPFGVSLKGGDVVVGNADSFGGGEAMLEIRSLEMSGGLPARLRGAVWIEDLTLDLTKARIVADERGRINVETFLERLFAREDGTGAMPFQAERVRLLVEQVEFVDLSALVATRRSVRPMLDVEARDVASARELLGPLVELGKRLGALPKESKEGSSMLGEPL